MLDFSNSILRPVLLPPVCPSQPVTAVVDLITCSSRHDYHCLLLFNYIQYFRNIALFGCNYSLFYSVDVSRQNIVVYHCRLQDDTWLGRLGTSSYIFNLTFHRFQFCDESLPEEGGEAPVHQYMSVCSIENNVESESIRAEPCPPSSLPVAPELFIVRSLVR